MEINVDGQVIGKQVNIKEKAVKNFRKKRKSRNKFHKKVKNGRKKFIPKQKKVL